MKWFKRKPTICLECRYSPHEEILRQRSHEALCGKEGNGVSFQGKLSALGTEGKKVKEAKK